MVHSESGDDIDELVGRVVEEYFARLNRGDQPQLEEFVEQYPEIRDLLKTVIPGLQAAEQSPDVSVRNNVSREQHKQLGDFRILRQIGRGGMGIVYEAEQISMDRRVALKVLPLAGLVDELKIRRFRNEVRAVAALDHPNIVPVYMVGDERGVHYFAMRLIHGRSLSEVLTALCQIRDGGHALDGSSMSQVTNIDRFDERSKIRRDRISDSSVDALSPAEPIATAESIDQADISTVPQSSHREYFRCVAKLGIQAAMALQHAHDQGIVHRDIKPANLMLDSESKLYVTDFGLARIESDVGVTMTGDMVGTLRYMAPEQALAKRVVVDHRTDIYSLAVTLYELLALRPAYVAEDRHQLLKQIAFEEPTPLRRIDAGIPVELETIVHKAMSKEVAQRYSSAAELADDLRSHLENRPIKARPPTPSEIIGKWTRRNPILTWATIVTLSIVSVTLAVSTLLIAKQRDMTQDQLTRAKIAERETKQAKRLADLHLLDSLRQQASAMRLTGMPGQRLKSLEALRHAGDLLSTALLSDDERRTTTQALRNEVISSLPLTDFVVRKEWPSDARNNNSGVSLTARRYAVHDPDGNIRIYDLDSSIEVAHLPGEGLTVIRTLIFSPDGRYLAAMYQHDQVFIVWRIEDRRPVLRCQGFPGVFDFFPNSAAIITGNRGGDLLIYSTATGKQIGEVSLPEAVKGLVAKGISVHPNNSEIALAFNGSKYVFVHDLTTTTETRHGLPDAASSVVWSPSGHELCVGLKQGDICILRPQQPKAKTRMLRGHNAVVRHLAFLHGGNSLVSHSWDSTTRVWDIASLRQVLILPASVTQESDEPHGSIVAFGGKTAGIAEVVRPNETRLSPHGQRCIAVIHPRLPLVMVGGDGRADILHLKSMKLLARLPIADGTVYTGVVASTGEFLTSSAHGIYIWPVVSDSNEVRLGPPTCLRKGDFKRFESSVAGDKIAAIDGDRVLIIDRQDPNRDIYTNRHAGLDCVALSPDGHFVATSTWNAKGARVFDATTGKLIRDLLPDAKTCSVEFSPDGKTLTTGTRKGYSIWEVATWNLIKTLDIPTRGGRPYAVSNAQRSWMALRMDRSLISLRGSDGEELARFRAYPDALVDSITLSPQADFLVVNTEHGCRSWDLGAVSRQLRDLNLGSLDDRPLETVAGRDVDLRVKVDLGELAERDRAIKNRQQLVERVSTYALGRN